MKEFFHGWRRKAGVATLLMSCVLASLWIRSALRREVLYYFTAERQHAVFVSHGRLLWMSRPYSKKNGFWIIAKDDSFWNDIFFAVDENWGPVYTGRLFRYRRLVAPLWPLILPLTLLSAYLILWKPRKRA